MIMISYMDMLDLSKDECGLYLENVYKKAIITSLDIEILFSVLLVYDSMGSMNRRELTQ